MDSALCPMEAEGINVPVHSRALVQQQINSIIELPRAHGLVIRPVIIDHIEI